MGRRSAINAFLLAGALLAPSHGLALQGEQGDEPRFDLSPRASMARVEGLPGEETLTITAAEADLDAVITQIARASQREVKGLDVLSRHPRVTANLAGTDLRDSLRWIGGSVGMRITLTASEIRVAEDLPLYPDRQTLFFRAYSGYTNALRDHSESEFAPQAAWNRAVIESETPGREKEAAEAFDGITATHPKSDLVPDALLEAGKLFGRANLWGEAAARFDALAAHPREHGHSVTARRLLADAHTRIAEAMTNPVSAQENARRAILVLDALDDDDPTRDMYERRRRSLVRSRAESLVGNPVGALKALDIAEKYSDRGPNDPEVARLRALAFDRSERHADACRAWLRLSTLVEGEDRAASYERAAAAANAGREHLTAITIWKKADSEGLGDTVKRHADAAYIALDLVPPRLDIFGDSERLSRGEGFVRREMFDEAIDALRPIFDRRSTLERDEHRRLAFAYSRALARKQRTDEAMLVLRKSAGEMTRGSDRRDVYLFAARLLEEADEIDRAIAALEGRL